MQRILISDDEQDTRLVLREILEEAGFRVEEATNGAEALKLCRIMPMDLIITDLFMPEKDGLEFLMELRRRNRLLPVIAISGGGHLFSKAEALSVAQDLGATAILNKPFTCEEILRVVRSSLLAAKAGNAQNTTTSYLQ